MPRAPHPGQFALRDQKPMLADRKTDDTGRTDGRVQSEGAREMVAPAPPAAPTVCRDDNSSNGSTASGAATTTERARDVLRHGRWGDKEKGEEEEEE